MTTPLQEIDLDRITEWLRSHIGHGRLLHTLGVVQLSVTLAGANGVETEKVIPAALLHDCAKGMAIEEQRQLAESSPWSLDGGRVDLSGFYHGPAGAMLARDRFGVSDMEVLDAIAYHTTGCRNPSRLLQVIMAADYCEPTRQYPGVEGLREAVLANLREGLVRVLRHKEQYLLSKGRAIHHGLYDTLAALGSDGQFGIKGDE